MLFDQITRPRDRDYIFFLLGGGKGSSEVEWGLGVGAWGGGSYRVRGAREWGEWEMEKGGWGGEGSRGCYIHHSLCMATGEKTLKNVGPLASMVGGRGGVRMGGSEKRETEEREREGGRRLQRRRTRSGVEYPGHLFAWGVVPIHHGPLGLVSVWRWL